MERFSRATGTAGSPASPADPASSPRAVLRVLRVLGAAILGVGLAAVAEFLLFVGPGSSLNLVVWAVIGIALGALSRRWSTAIWVDAVVGFAIVFSYSIMGYQGSAPLMTALAPFALIALGGAAGMAAAGAAGFAVKRLFSRRGRST